jgi:osmotically-inducible protein OsmY
MGERQEINMVRKSGDQRSGKERRIKSSVSRRTIEQDEDTGSQDDVPNYGDSQRPSTDATSGARGQEGLGNPEEQTWGEEQFRAERREEDERRQAERGQRARRRPDETLAQEIREILANDPELDATDIEIEVEGGAVTLSGVVDESDAKLLAEELVETLPGVREVHNRIRVER